MIAGRNAARAATGMLCLFLMFTGYTGLFPGKSAVPGSTALPVLSSSLKISQPPATAAPEVFLLSATPYPVSGSTTPELHQPPARVPVLAYHSVRDNAVGIEQLSVGEKAFENQMKYLAGHGYTALTFSELRDFKSCSKPILLTFDDGYEDNYTKAYPVLKKYGFKATVFLIAGEIGKPGYLTREEIMRMEDLVSFQSHTVTHPHLNSVSPAQLTHELEESKRRIAALTGSPVLALAYPYGDYSDAVLRVASCLYDFAVTMKSGYYSGASANLEMRRIPIWRSYSLGDFISVVR
jgi:peptidoglycan/xylan/chitin deacetylase (PgdA/CDA1 family)